MNTLEAKARRIWAYSDCLCMISLVHMELKALIPALFSIAQLFINPNFRLLPRGIVRMSVLHASERISWSTFNKLCVLLPFCISFSQRNNPPNNSLFEFSFRVDFSSHVCLFFPQGCMDGLCIFLMYVPFMKQLYDRFHKYSLS